MATSNTTSSQRSVPLLTPTVTEMMIQELPGVVAAVETLAKYLPSYATVAISGIDSKIPTEDAKAIIHHQWMNDLISLIQTCMSCDGRSALRAARSLFEHEVNYHTVGTDPIEAARYCAHADALFPTVLRVVLDLEERTSSGKRLKAARHHIHKATKAAATPKATVLKQYGSQFERQWATRSLRQRSEAMKLDIHYGYYRVASAILHGTTAGLIGSRREYAQSEIVLRTGITPRLGPLAWELGLGSSVRFLEMVSGDIGAPVIKSMLEAVQELYRESSIYRAAAEDLDDHLWPDQYREPRLILFISPNGSRYWHLYNAADGVIALAETPQLPAEIERLVVEASLNAAPRDLPQLWLFPQLSEALPGARWQQLHGLLGASREILVPQLQVPPVSLPFVLNEALQALIESIWKSSSASLKAS